MSRRGARRGLMAVAGSFLGCVAVVGLALVYALLYALLWGTAIAFVVWVGVHVARWVGVPI